MSLVRRNSVLSDVVGSPKRQSTLDPSNDARDFWVDDKYASRCFLCKKKFHFLRRKHHCRFCGQIFCSDCLVRLAPGTHGAAKISTSVKVCRNCQSNLLTRTNQRNQSEVQNSAIFNARAPQPTLFSAMTEGIEEGSSDSSSSNSSECCESGDDDTHLIEIGEVEEIPGESDQECVQCGVNTRAARHIETVDELLVTYGLYNVPVRGKDTVKPWVQKLESDAMKRYMRQVTPIPKRRDRIYIPDTRAHFTLETNYEKLLISTAFDEALMEESRREMLTLMEERCSLHLQKRVECICEERGLSPRWVDSMCDLAWRVVSSTAIDRNPRFMSHVEVLNVEGGLVGNSEILSGVAFFKQVTNRKMRTRIEMPRILLLGGNVGSPPVGPDYDLLEYSESYPGWLDKLYSRVRVWRPHVIVVEKSMHHFMQDLVSDDNITLVCQVPRKVLERLERACGAAIIDDLAKVPISEVQRVSPTGSCSQFLVRPVGEKVIMEFNGLLRPTFTTVVLRGAGQNELDECRQALSQVFTSAYHLTLQTHYLMDFWAVLAHQIDHPTSPVLSGRESRDLATLASAPPESLTMNMGVVFPEEIQNELVDVNYSRDNIVVNYIVLPNETEEGNVGNPASTTKLNDGNEEKKNDLAEHQSRRHAGHLRVFPFYGEGDETISEFLAERSSEGDSSRLFLHGNRKIVVTTKIEPRDMHSQGRDEYNATALCSTFCKACRQVGRPGTSGDLPLSRHTLNMSFGSLLEMSVHGSDGCCGRCGHRLHGDIQRSFTVFPTEQTQVTVSFDVDYIPVYNLHGPRATMVMSENPTETYFEMELEELKAQVTEFLSRKQSTLITEQLESYLADIHSMRELREFRAHVYKPMLDEFAIASKVGASGAQQRNTKLLVEDVKGLWPPDLYFHEILGEEFRVDEHSSIIALALEAALVGGATVGTNTVSPFDLSLQNINMGHRRVTSMSMEGFNFRDSVPSSAKTADATIMFPTSPPDHLRQISIGDSPVENNSSSHTVTPTHIVESPTVVGEHPGSSGPEHSNAELQQEQTMEQLFLMTTNRQATVASEHFDMSDMSDAIDILLGGGKSRGGAKTKIAQDNMAKFQCEYMSMEDGGRVSLRVESLFPHQFAALRYLYTKGNPDVLISSLKRCQTFDPGAGKSGSGFFVTRDDKFVLKAVKKEELMHFVRHFNSVYFAHMGHLFQQKTPADDNGSFDNSAQIHSSFLVKILGVYTITTKKQRAFGQQVKHYILMENLFFKRHKDIIYDLKGSQLNRLADEHNVQLDENLVQQTKKGYFFFTKEERKSWLDATLSIDAALLCNSRIMDYSLVAGVDSQSHSITVGIIDFLRPYTLDKAAESAFKSAKASAEAWVEGASTVEDPTIIEPPNYRDRFLRWMGTYFCSVPEKTSQNKRVKRNAELRKKLSFL